MKLIVQIPCFNEEDTLPQTVADIPRQIEGIEKVEILIIDDGSHDNTVAVAKKIGVDHIVENTRNIGLAGSFQKGVDRCLELGADIIVNTDGDNQYAGGDIPALVRPILDGKADVVVGDRQTSEVEHFSSTKKFLQRFGSFVVRNLSGVDIPDAVSGFRAISREAALKINIVSSFSYTIEMLIQAGKKRMAIESVPVGVNAKTRDSRLFRSIPGFIKMSSMSMIRTYAMYQPLRVFVGIGLVLSFIGIFPLVRFVVSFALGDGVGHIQSLVIGSSLLVIGFVTFLIGLAADLINFNRRLIERTLESTRRIELHLNRLEHDEENRSFKIRQSDRG
ncbi:glycosyltransferase family 2 protein [Denitrobaculum tricleocarpae]|uniref:Glycosyltransferase family 2 protein n=1 Tax=Denitrobaculum tricleocarpae TaxID=2591009 RepID=A0A545T5M6_9PROT|nr:glycosyltransferase family 2 protein [Denitrobaculum tricleocarpae]TQV72550.1 glycosyltransferase family 2 protein [Denitrobaculum tricleocarpae]